MCTANTVVNVFADGGRAPARSAYRATLRTMRAIPSARPADDPSAQRVSHRHTHVGPFGARLDTARNPYYFHHLGSVGETLVQSYSSTPRSRRSATLIKRRRVTALKGCELPRQDADRSWTPLQQASGDHFHARTPLTSPTDRRLLLALAVEAARVLEPERHTRAVERVRWAPTLALGTYSHAEVDARRVAPGAVQITVFAVRIASPSGAPHVRSRALTARILFGAGEPGEMHSWDGPIAHEAPVARGACLMNAALEAAATCGGGSLDSVAEVRRLAFNGPLLADQRASVQVRRIGRVEPRMVAEVRGGDGRLLLSAEGFGFVSPSSIAESPGPTDKHEPAPPRASSSADRRKKLAALAALLKEKGLLGVKP